MGNRLCCTNDKDPIHDICRAPIFMNRLHNNKSKLNSNLRVYSLDINTESKKLNCAHYSDSQQCLGDKHRIQASKNLNVEHSPVFKACELERNINIPMWLRKEDDLASIKLSPAASPDSSSNLVLRKNIKQRWMEYQESENPRSDKIFKTSRIPPQVVTALSQWMKSERIGLKALTEKLKTDARLQAQITATGNEMSRKKCPSDLEIQRLSSSTNYYPDNKSITTVINHSSSTTSVISKQLEELPDFHEDDFLAFSNTNLERKKCRSLRASEIVANLPPLSDALKDMFRGSSKYGNEEEVYPDRDSLVSPFSEKKSSTGRPSTVSLIMADIELLEQSINEKTVAINKLRKHSVNILTAGYESDLKYESDGDTDMSLWLDVEKKVNLLEDEKLDLVRKKDISVSQLQGLNYLRPDGFHNFPLFIAQERPPKAKLEVSNSSLPPRNDSTRLSFRELSYEDSF